MKLCLKITMPQGPSFDFEHAGTCVRVGRNPEAELSLQGPAAEIVSWDHARIDLSPHGAAVTDLGSSNGTFVNDKPVDKKSPIRLGDHIQLGLTGPKMQVTALELLGGATGGLTPRRSPASSVEPPTAPNSSLPTVRDRAEIAKGWQPTVLIAIGLIGAVAVLGILVKAKPPGGETTTTTADARAPSDATVRPDPAPEKAAPVPISGKGPEPGPLSAKLAQPRSVTGDDAKVEGRDVGEYRVLPKAPPCVLCQRSRDLEIWGKVAPGSRIQTEQVLVSLPGYRSTIALDSAVSLTLWGNAPAFSERPPVLESSVVLHTPPDRVDLSFTLDHGRVHIANNKPNATAQIRAHFLQENWELSLPDHRTEVVLELWGYYSTERPGQTTAGPTIRMDLFVDGGQARLRAGGRDIPLPKRSHLFWSTETPTVSDPKVLDGLPDWWTTKLARKDKPEIADTMDALTNYHALLETNAVVFDVVRTQVRESADPAMRALGVLFLGALDAVPHLIDALEDREHPEVRSAARIALQMWMCRSVDHHQELVRMLTETKGFPPQKVGIIMELLHGYSDSAAKRPETAAKLIGYLDHENLLIRDMAWQRLIFLAPRIAKDIPYDPKDEADKRKVAIDKWNRRLAQTK